VKIALLLVGFGNVARRFVHLLDESRAYLEAEGIEPVIVGIVTRRHGSMYDKAGLDAIRAALTVAEGGSLGLASSAPSAHTCVAQLRSQSIETRVLIETTTLDVRSGEPATSHILDAIRAGVHVVTANKGPVACHYRTIAREANAAHVRFLFEGAVMDGVPIFNLVRQTLPGVQIRGIRGVVNSTTNYILSALEAGQPFADALAHMQRAGIAEADPSLDIDGWDAAAKISALANVLLNADMTPQLVAREGIDADTAARVRQAMSNGRRLKLVASAAKIGDRIDARVALEELPLNDPLAILDGPANAVEFDTWPMGRLVITQRDGGLEQTAYALLSDLVAIARSA
jgi:homoserine dehydrogenase